MLNQRRVTVFLETAIERHRIYKNKMAGEPKPWTTNPVLEKFHFCNVFRQYDKCSVWMIENIIKKAKSFEELWPAIIVYRYISSMNIYLELQDSVPDLFDMENVHARLRHLRNTTDIKFNGCFLRNPKIKGGWAPIHEVPFLLVKEIQEDNQLATVAGRQSFESMTGYLVQFSATSGFMAHQYCCDMSYSRWWAPTDSMTFATMGPGSRQGMNILLDRPRRDRLRQDEWLSWANLLREKLALRFSVEFPEEVVTLQEVQNWLCEFQKYVKYQHMLAHGTRVKARIYRG